MILLQNYLWADYYGREHLGSIRGIVTPFTLALAAIGPPIAGYVYDGTGSYNSVWWIGFALMVGAAMMLVVTRRPDKRFATEPEPLPV
jgi:cyanate permease